MEKWIAALADDLAWTPEIQAEIWRGAAPERLAAVAWWATPPEYRERLDEAGWREVARRLAVVGAPR